MYKNLKAEMIRQEISIAKIADTLGLKVDTARLKVNGKLATSIEDCKKIAKLFHENNEIEYLFKTH